MNHKLHAILAASVLTITGCSSSFQSVTGATAACTTNCLGNGSSGVDGSGGGASQPADPWKTTTMDGQLESGRFALKQVISIDKVTKELVVKLPMPANPYIDGAIIDAPLPEVEGAHIVLEPNGNGGSSLVLRVPLKHVIKGVDSLPPTRLPNGDPLPAVADGEAPALALQLSQIKDIKATVYFNVSMVGVFVNTPFDPLIYLSIPVKNKEGTRTWGYLTSVPAKNGKDGGFFISVAIPDDIARVIDDNI